jgi:hypothetical protein
MNRAFLNMWPTPTSTTIGFDTLSAAELDRLFNFQIALAKPKELCAATLYIMGVTTTERTAAKTMNKLVEIGVLQKGSAAVNTRNIGPQFAHQVYILPKWALKRLVCVLFAWEEELMRWRALEEERADLLVVMQEERREGGGDGGHVGHLEVRVFEIDGLWRLAPSVRERRRDQRGMDEELPGYEEQR